MKGTKFYKRNYLIAIYDEDDQLVAVCDNEREFAEMFGMSRGTACSTLSRIFNGERTFIYENGEKRLIYFIPLDPKEIKEFQLIY